MITEPTREFKRDCNLLAMFYFTFMSFSKEKPTKSQILDFVKKYHKTEMREASEALKFLKKL